MLRSAVVALVLAALAASAAAQSPARVPVRIYLVSPADRPDKPTIMTAATPKSHEVKHFASTWGASLFWYFNVGPDCQATQLETTLVDPPAHGRLFLSDGSVPGSARWPTPFSKADPRSSCARLAMRNGAYQPDPGFTGRDHLTVSFREGDAASTDAIEIDVRRAEHPNPLAGSGRP
jgi:hypothetical protein